ncbi:MAG: hypothetical protein U5L00_21075 [Desulfovermiculus sp.]|nr:hypothetical protein [Desulfovermiculus sp.]
MHTTLTDRSRKLSSGFELLIADSRIEEETIFAVFYANGAATSEKISVRYVESGLQMAIQVDPLFGDVQLAEE